MDLDLDLDYLNDLSLMEALIFQHPSIPRREEPIIPNWLFEQERNRREEPIIPNWLFEQERNLIDEIVEEVTSELQGITEDERPLINDMFQHIIFHPLLYFLVRERENHVFTQKQSVKVELKETKKKAINQDRNTECPITYDTINTNDSYLACMECKYNFTVDAIVKHLDSRDCKDCPMCRKEWKDYCIYVNIDPEVERKKVAEKCLIAYNYEINNLKKKHLKMEEYVGVNKTRNNKKWFYGK